MTKQDALKELDKNILRIMINATKEGGDTSVLPELNPAIQYLAKNNLTEDKKESTIEDEIKQKVKDANDRRKAKELNK